MKRKNITPQIPIERIVPNPEQPRTVFDMGELKLLAGSIREHGVIQPISVEECGKDYILHDGERRLRAAKMAGLKWIPATILPPLNSTGPRERLERALVANVQRVEMHLVEEGRAYARLMKEFGYSATAVAHRVHKHPARVTFAVQLVTQLEDEILQLMLDRQLPASDTRILPALLKVPAGTERITLCQEMAARNATATMLIHAAKNYNRLKEAAAARYRSAGGKKKHKDTGTPAEEIVSSRALPEWDALFQLGRVPPWQVVTDAVMKTCDRCPLRSMASPATCGDCPLVISLQCMMEVVNAH